MRERMKRNLKCIMGLRNQDRVKEQAIDSNNNMGNNERLEQLFTYFEMYNECPV